MGKQSKQESSNELKKIYAEVDLRLDALQTDVERYRADIEKIELAFEEGDLSLDEFVEDMRYKDEQINQAIDTKQPLCRALYLIGRKIKEAK